MIKGGGVVQKKFNKETKNCGRVNEEVLFKILKQILKVKLELSLILRILSP